MSKKLMIDAGHGGTDTGARAFGTNEKEWTLRMSKYQYDRLKKLGAKVSITRTDDRTLDPNPRTDLIKGKFDICISNHFNAFNGKARGVETIHSIHRAKQLATDIANALVKTTGLPLRRVFTRQLDDGRDYYFMIRQTPGVDTVIIEYGFLDNQADYSWYSNKNNFYKAAEAVIEVLCRYLGIKYVAPDGSNSKPTPAPKPTPQPKPSTSKQTLHLPASAETWRVYKPNGPYTKGNEVHLLTPSAYGGLDYEIKGNPAKDVYLIDTDVKGRVAIYAGAETGAKITNNKAPVAKLAPKAKRLYLPASAKLWKIYNPKGPYTSGSEIHNLTPSAYGGLDYEIKGNPASHVYLIDTGVKGRVAIYAHPSTGAVIK